MKYYGIYYGFAEGEYISIDEGELRNAIILFIQGSGRGVFKNGCIRGQDIIKILPDWHTTMGWNKGYKMQGADYQAVKGLEKAYNETFDNAKKSVIGNLDTKKLSQGK